MSDALLTQLVDEIKGLRADIAKFNGSTRAAAAGASGAKPETTKPAATAGKNTAADNKAAKTEKPAGPPAGTKAPGGKRTIDQVRDMIRKVAANEALGKQTAKDILADDGGGVEKVVDLKPEFYDKVYEACEVALNGEGKAKAEAAEDDDLL